MAKRKRTKVQTMIHKTLNRKKNKDSKVNLKLKKLIKLTNILISMFLGLF
jgi:hypothetical protein